MNKKIIGIFGSAIFDKEEIHQKAKKLGKALGKYKDEIILINGACPGLPYLVVFEAAKHGVEIWGFSPCLNFTDQKKEIEGLDMSFYKKILFLPKNLPFVNDINVARKYRNVYLTASCQAGIIIGGRTGTLNEFTNLYDMGKIIGVYEGTGGVADLIKEINQKIKKTSLAKIFFEKDPEKLVRLILEALKKS